MATQSRLVNAGEPLEAVIGAPPTSGRPRKGDKGPGSSERSYNEATGYKSKNHKSILRPDMCNHHHSLI